MGLDSEEGPSAGLPEPMALLDVEVVRSLGPGTVCRCRLQLPPGSRVEDALRAAQVAWEDQGLPAEPSAPSAASAPSTPTLVAIWGRRCALDRPLRTGDRVEWLRPLVVDPKESRRLRYRRTGGRQGGIERGLAARPRETPPPKDEA